MPFYRGTRFKKNRLGSVATKTKLGGFTFDSKFEGSLYMYLQLLEKGGEIRDMRVKPNVRITDAKILMIPDFSAFHPDLNETVYHEAKGFETEVWLLKKRLWRHYGPGRLRVYKGSAKSFTMVEEIIPEKE